MIDYKKVSKSIRANKYKINLGNQNCPNYKVNKKCLKYDPLYCFGDCSFCNHPNKCVWNPELMQIRELKARKFIELNDLRQVYSNMSRDNKTYLNYTPRDCRFEISMLKQEIKMLYKKEDEIETLSGGKI